MDMDEEEAAWDMVRDKLNVEVQSGEFTEFYKALDKATADLASVEKSEQNQESSDLEDSQAGPSTSKTPPKRSVGRMRKQTSNSTVESLLGQANLEHARGFTKKAMAYLFEAIKLSPYHAQTYKTLSDIYAEFNQAEKSFEFKMLAALLLADKTSAEEWYDIAETACTFERYEVAVASLAKAIRKDPDNWIYYEKRIQILDSIGDVDLAMRTRLQAAQSVDCQVSRVGFAWIEQHIKMAADYFCTMRDEEKATDALEIFIFRSREFQRPIDFEHLALLRMWMSNGRFDDSAKSILALHESLIKAVNPDGSLFIEITHTTHGYVVQPFPPAPHVNWQVDPQLPTLFIAPLIICFIHMGHYNLISKLTERLLERAVGPNEENAYLEIARSLHAMEQLEMAINYLERLREVRPEFEESADAWFLYGYFQQQAKKPIIARSAYEMVISIQPGHIDARINLSTILQEAGEAELAMETLKDLNLDSCSQIPDERLLVRQAEVLGEQKKTAQYISCLRMLLIPHFYQVYTRGDEATQQARRKVDKILFQKSLKRCALEAIQGKPLEKMVKRLGAIAENSHRSLNDLSHNQLHDYAFALAEALCMTGAYEEMLCVVCYAFLHPNISIMELESESNYFSNLLFFAAIKAQNFSLAFEFLRFFMNQTYPKIGKSNDIVARPSSTSNELLQMMAGLPSSENMGRIYVAMNYILCQYQTVNYHRFIMRQLVKQPDSDALHIISGNNSLVTGAYRHALGEYFLVWLRQRENPMLALLIALTFCHIACKKDISSRHIVGVKALAFMHKYAKLRAPSLSQEMQYNMGRMFHQMGVLPNAVQCYERVLYECPTPQVWVENPMDVSIKPKPAMRYDLRRQAAYNLSLIYEGSGNRPMARHVLKKFCTI